MLALPSGRLERPAERIVAGSLYACVVVTHTLRYLAEHPRPPQSWSTQDGIQSIWDPVASVTGSVLTAAAMVLIVRRWRAAGRPTRRTHALVWITGTIMGFTVLITALANLLDMSEQTHHLLAVAYTLGLILTPFAILAGVLRVRIARMRVANLVLRLETTPEPKHLRGALADTLGDPTLAEGLSNPAIAEQLNYSLKTIEKRFTTITQKLGLPDAEIGRGDINIRVLTVLTYLRSSSSMG